MNPAFSLSYSGIEMSEVLRFSVPLPNEQGKSIEERASIAIQTHQKNVYSSIRTSNRY